MTEGGLVDIVAEAFDAGVRLSGSVPKDVVAARFGQEQGFVVADAPTYVVGRAVPITPHDRQAHRGICNRPPSGALWRREFNR